MGGAVSTSESVAEFDAMSISSDGTDELSLEEYCTNCEKANEATNCRIADWTIEVLAVLLKEIDARRGNKKLDKGWEKLGENERRLKKGSTVIDEVKETNMFPEFDSDAARREKIADEATLSGEAFSEACHYVRTIASIYNRNRKCGIYCHFWRSGEREYCHCSLFVIVVF